MRLLLAEDNPADVELVRLALEARPDVMLEVVHDGQAALDCLRTRRAQAPDFLLLDLKLPRKTGLDVLAEVRSDPELRWLPVIVLSSSKAPTDVARAYANHVTGYFTKPSIGFDAVMTAILAFMEQVEAMPIN